ncbi:PASTA domain-containing protein [Mollicutes bacterium LVI A0078]|nr:PASTA domain-containing protein [Mollicutes bacterium LVI A0075]WOO91487.1 PASTA domain-containing protein [Mollicutes bacterium LVI A0078]
MSDFLNNFSNDKYKKQVAADKENQDTIENKQETKQQLVKSEGNELKLELSGAAFEEEKISIDKDYNQFLFKRTVVICVTIIVAILIFVSSYWYMNQTVAITLVDKSQTDAVKWLDDNKVNYDLITVESQEKPSGTVISQSIPSGEKIGVLDLQTIEVSSGPNMDEVVKLTGLEGKSKEQINNLIENKMLVNASLKYEYSDKVDNDKLIRIDFEDDSVSEKNYTRSAKAEFVISKGSKEEKKNVKVDNFVNQTIDSVYEWNQDTGIMIDEEQIPSDIPEGYIVSQSVEPGTMLGYGDVITVEISKGPGEYTPYLIGYNIDDATEVAAEINLSLEPAESYSDSNAGVIIYQSKAEGESIYPEEESLKVTVSLGQPFITDMSGATIGDLASMINDFNTQGANLSYTTTEVALSDEDKEAGVRSGTIKSISNANSFVNVGSTLTVEVYE